MTDQPRSTGQVPTRWALLIGINHYLDGDARGGVLFKDLYGCVNDVTRVKKYIKNIGGVNITKLTSEALHRSLKSPLEARKRWPTHENVVKELTRIHNSARPGDLVYIHYSGHGISRGRTQIHDGGDSLNGTALAMMDVNAGGPYLSGYALGVYVRRMVELKGLRVTVVLDSCFSGEGFRDLDDVPDMPLVTCRTSDFPFDGSWLPSDGEAENAARRLDPGDEVLHRATRDVIVEHSWLSKPVGCTVICACDRDQKASEAVLAGAGGRTGYLTHWMLDLLNRYPVACPPSSSRLRGYAAQRLESDNRQQTPRVHGESFYQFFGNCRVIQRPECAVLAVSPRIKLAVGKAQGAAAGARYHVFPQDRHFEVGPLLSDVGPQQKNMVEVEISEAFDLVSHAIVVPTSKPASTKIRAGDRAIPYRWAFDKPIYIQLIRMPPRVLKSLKLSTEAVPGLKIAATGLVHFVVTIDTDNTFMVCDSSKTPMKRIPKIHLDDPDAISKTAAVIRHLARYTSLRSISHMSPRSLAATAGISAELLDANGNRMSLDRNSRRYLIREGQQITVSIQNLTPRYPTHVTFLCLNQVWGVDKLSPADGQPATSLDGDRPSELTVRPRISRRPGDEAYIAGGADETVRVCVCMGRYPVSWDELILQGLPVDARRVWTVHAPLEPIPPQGTEGRRGDGPMEVVKGVEEVPRREWMFLDFNIRTLPVSGKTVSRKAKGGSR